jgi:nicotinamidase-related amidase
MVTPQNAVLALVDIQVKLAAVMDRREDLIRRLVQLTRGCRLLGIPILLAEQNPARMGITIPELRDVLPDLSPVPKMTFSCWRDPAWAAALKALGRDRVILAGIETHVCIAQTAADLVSAGYAVEVVADAVSSRLAADKATGLEQIKAAPAIITCVESVLFELLGTAEHPAFKEILRLVK